MDPFNIVIRKEGQQLGLNIHPKDKLSYMIFCEGILVGEIFLDGEGQAWGSIAAKDLASNTDNYSPSIQPAECEGMMDNKQLVGQIGEEISKLVNFN